MTKIQEKKKTKPHAIEEILSKSMSNSIWKNLPHEVLENVLACLPTHVLCRFCLVCKEWNHFISQPSFAKLRAFSPRKVSSIFVSPKLIYNAMTTSSEWHVLNPTEKRSYKLSDSFIMDSYFSKRRNRGLRNASMHLAWSKYTLAADGELIYTMYLAPDWPTSRPMHIVCNPVSKSFHEIPELPEFGDFDDHNIVVMSVDCATQIYKIVIMESYWTGTTPGSQDLFLYESVTLAWKKLCKVPGIGLSMCSGIFMKGIFYALFMDLSGIPYGHKLCYTIVLYSCDLVTGAWCKVDVDFPLLSAGAEENLQLVLSLGRLYILKFTRCRIYEMRLSIWKIVLETKEVVEVAKIHNLFKLSNELIQLKKLSKTPVSEMPVAVGCADSIIILCKEGRRIKFNLLEKNWQELLHDTLDKDIGAMPSGICACLVDL